MVKEIDLKAVKIATELIQQLYARTYALVTEVAKRLKYNDIDLMEYINQNPDLFHIETIYKYKTKKVKRKLFSNDYTEDVLVKTNPIGVGIKNVYLSADKNFRTTPWLQQMIESKQKYIQIKPWSNYGHIEGYYVEPDKQDSYRSHLWRNTLDKIEYLRQQGILNEATFFIGGFGDCSSHKIKTAINDDGVKKLIQLGWTFDGYPLKK